MRPPNHLAPSQMLLASCVRLLLLIYHVIIPQQLSLGPLVPRDYLYLCLMMTLPQPQGYPGRRLRHA